MKSYILQHTDDIKKYHQALSPWWITKNGGLDARVGNALKKGALDGIALDSNTNYPAPISREDVINYFHQNLYRGFMAAMIWGKTRRLKTIVNISPKDIEDKLKRIETKLKQGEIKDAFISMCKDSLISKCDSNKIEGVDWAFFTKVLFFMGKAFAPKRRPIPLILDSHMMYIHCALLIDDNEDVEKYYKWYIDKKGNEGVTWLRTSSDFKSEVYLDYINRMHTISFNKGYSADKLEEYLFDKIPVSPGYDIYENVKKILRNTNASITDKKRNNPNLIQANNSHKTQEKPPIYRMDVKDGGHYVFEEEQLTFRGIPILLILCRTSSGKSHFCGFWNKDVPNTNIDSISEIQDIINELSLSSLKWQNKPEYSRKYVMYTSKDSYNKAKELKDKISQFIHKMNK